MTEQAKHFITVFGPGLKQNCERFHMKTDYIDFMWDGLLGRIVYDSREKSFSVYRAKSYKLHPDMERITKEITYHD